MAYDLLRLFGLVCDQLNSSPVMSLKTLSSQIGVERHTIERTIKNVAGMTFRQLRNQVTIDRIKVLMRSRPELTMKELAGRLNYSSQSAFTRFVKGNTGSSPTKLRGTSLRKTSTPKRHSQVIGI
jgi:AraC-like DNA-binding protein